MSGLTFIEKVSRQSWVPTLVINIFVSVRRYFKVDEKTGEVFSLLEFQENLEEENQDTSFNLIINARSVTDRNYINVISSDEFHL